MNKIENFINEVFGEVKCFEKKGELWFCANDVLKILDYGETGWGKKVSRLNQKGVTKCHTLTKGGNQELNYINELNLYRLVFGSKLDKAQEFQDWICGDVIPKLRKNGYYNMIREKSRVDHHNFHERMKEVGVTEGQLINIDKFLYGIVSMVITPNHLYRKEEHFKMDKSSIEFYTDVAQEVFNQCERMIKIRGILSTREVLRKVADLFYTSYDEILEYRSTFELQSVPYKPDFGISHLTVKKYLKKS